MNKYDWLTGDCGILWPLMLAVAAVAIPVAVTLVGKAWGCW